MYKKENSIIHGIGIHATVDIPEGEILGDYLKDERGDGFRYVKSESMKVALYEQGILGRYCNHQTNCNADVVVVSDTDLKLMSKGIKIGEEITSDYNVAADFIGYPIDTSNFTELA